MLIQQIADNNITSFFFFFPLFCSSSPTQTMASTERLRSTPSAFPPHGAIGVQTIMIDTTKRNRSAGADSGNASDADAGTTTTTTALAATAAGFRDPSLTNRSTSSSSSSSADLFNNNSNGDGNNINNGSSSSTRSVWNCFVPDRQAHTVNALARTRTRSQPAMPVSAVRQVCLLCDSLRLCSFLLYALSRLPVCPFGCCLLCVKFLCV